MAQKKLLLNYASENGFEIVDFLKRQAQIKDVECRCRVIFVEMTDRLYRNLKDHVSFEHLDVEIHCIPAQKKNPDAEVNTTSGF